LLSILAAAIVTSAGCAAPYVPRFPDAAPGTRYLFVENFGGTSLDLRKWQPNWLGPDNTTVTPPVNGAEESCYDPRQVSVPGDGYLHLRAVARQCRDNRGRTYAYASGLVNTARSFNFTYGRIEARVFLPGAGGRTQNWPAVWANGHNWPLTGEIDVMEGLAGRDCWHFHGPAGSSGGCANLANHAGWHTFAAEWRPGIVTFFYDGVRTGSLTKGITAAPMYLILNLAVSSSISPSIAVPSEMLVDWIRVSA
jgi:beta-glucanase (GH16 family)